MVFSLNHNSQLRKPVTAKPCLAARKAKEPRLRRDSSKINAPFTAINVKILSLLFSCLHCIFFQEMYTYYLIYSAKSLYL